MTEQHWGLTVYQGLAGDHNGLAIPGALHLAQTFGHPLHRPLQAVGAPASALNTDWDAELQVAMPDLRALQTRLQQVYASGQRPLTFLTRCAAALATLPVLAEYHPDAVVVWFDAHADLNSPQTSSSGFLGGMVLSAATGIWESGLGKGLVPSQIIYVGVRDVDPPELALIDQRGIHVVPVSPSVTEELGGLLGNAPIYIHLDCDVMEPGLLPTDYSVSGGLTFEQLGDLMRLLSSQNVVGVEIAEFQDAAWAAHAAEGLWLAMQPLFTP
ncbi:arginase family protein [Deinococcus hopiensis]|uniref:Arginase n=1 Tax=Deinococcus hopiensis KR-140 TaxID=695939 RepID=A0A1W1VU54_9DEIO|nr:arginase family protein [Deinococcus hopiensis]SMB96895.1 arginase [Deinococcus hopiensis KR-140]